MFSTKTKQSIRAVATRAKGMAQSIGAAAFDWFSLLSLILGFIQANCKPKTEAARNSLIDTMARNCSATGMLGCIDACMTQARAAKLRKKMAKQGIKTEQEQDSTFYWAVMAAAAERTKAVAGMTSAYDGDEWIE